MSTKRQTQDHQGERYLRGGYAMRGFDDRRGLSALEMRTHRAVDAMIVQDR